MRRHHQQQQQQQPQQPRMQAGEASTMTQARTRREVELRRSLPSSAASSSLAVARVPSSLSLFSSSSSSSSLLVATLLLLLSLLSDLSPLSLRCAAQPPGPAEPVLLNSDEMRWASLSDAAVAAGAVCNDGSTPGFWASLSTEGGARVPVDGKLGLSAPVSLSDAAAAAAAPGSTAPAWSSKWVLYLEGGGACLDEYSCTLRATDYPDHVSTRNNTRTLPAANLLSADNRTNPITADHHHVFAHYCSSDFWIGRQAAQASPPPKVSSFGFQGASIFRWLVNDLVSASAETWLGSGPAFVAPSLLDATEVVLAGSSAGAIGAVNHANWLRETLRSKQLARWSLANSTAAAAGLPPPPAPQLVHVRLILDSGWFVNYQNQVGELSRIAGDAWNMHGPSGPTEETAALACADPVHNVPEVNAGEPAPGASNGVMCCFLASCMSSSFLAPDLHTLVVQSLYDSFLLGLGHSEILGDLMPNLIPGQGLEEISASSSPEAIEEGIALIQLVSSYGGAYNASFQLQRRKALNAAVAGNAITNMHFVLLSCFNHMYLPHKVEDSVEGVEPIWNRVSDQSWFKVKVGRRLGYGPNARVEERFLRDIMAQWHAHTAPIPASEELDWVAPSPPPLQYADICSQAQCNPTCPDFVDFSGTSYEDSLESTRIFHTNASFRFVLMILSLIWLFAPAAVQLVIWFWSILRRGLAAGEAQMMLLSSPLSPVRRRRARPGIQRYPSIMSMTSAPGRGMASITQKGGRGGAGGADSDTDDEETVARKAVVHFSFLSLHYWPVIIDGPKKAPEKPSARVSSSPLSTHAASMPAQVASFDTGAGGAPTQQQQEGGGQQGQAPPPPGILVTGSPSRGPVAPSSTTVTVRQDDDLTEGGTRGENGSGSSVRGSNGPSGTSSAGGGLGGVIGGVIGSTGPHHKGGNGVGDMSHPSGGADNTFGHVIEIAPLEAATFRDAIEAVAAAEAAEKAANGSGDKEKRSKPQRSQDGVEMMGIVAGSDAGGTGAGAGAGSSLGAPPQLRRIKSALAPSSSNPALSMRDLASPSLMGSGEAGTPSMGAVGSTNQQGGPRHSPLARTRTANKRSQLARSVSFKTAAAMAHTAATSASDHSAELSAMQAASGLPATSLTALSQPLLKGVNGRFSSGQMIALMGKSGCGKSTLLELLACRRTFGMTHGAMYVNGESIKECMGWMKASVGFVSQYGSAAVSTLSVLDNLLYAAKLRLPFKWSRQKKLQRVQAVIDMCGLASMKHVLVGSNEGDKGGLSGGQRRRVALALELLSAPRLLMLDEITSGLDASSALELLLVLHSIVESTNMCVVLSIHQPRVESWGLFHQVLVLDAGHVIFQGAPFAALHEFTQGIQEAAAWGLAKRDSEKLLRVSAAALESKDSGAQSGAGTGANSFGASKKDESTSASNVNVADFVLDCLKYPAIGRAMQQRYERVYRAEIIDLIHQGIDEAARVNHLSRPASPAEIPVQMPAPVLHRQRSMGGLDLHASMTAGHGGHRQRSMGEAPPGLHRQRSMFSSDALGGGGGGGGGAGGLVRTRTLHRRNQSTAAGSSAPAKQPALLRATVPVVSRWTQARQSVLNIVTLEARRLHAMSANPIQLLKMPIFFAFLGTVLPAAFFLNIDSALDTATWFVLLTNISNHMACTPLTFTFFDSMPLYYKELLSGAVTPLQHSVALSLHVSTLAILASNLGWIGGFLLSSPVAASSFDWGNLLTQILLECMCMRCFTLIYSLLVFSGYPKLNLETSTMVAAFTVSFCFVFSGFLVAPRLIPDYLIWILYANPMYWAFGAIVKVRLQELLRLSQYTGPLSSTGSSCEEGVSGWQCMLWQIPSFETSEGSTATTALVFSTYDLKNIDVYSSLFILLLMNIALWLLSWLMLHAPWRLTQPVECTLHVEQLALAASYRELQLEREFEAKQQQIRMREAEFKKVQQSAMEEVSAIASVRSKKAAMMASMDLTGFFALRGMARWAAITRQRLYGGGATLLLEMEAGADHLTSELSDPQLMKRYAQARAQAQLQQREMNQWNRMQQEAERQQVLVMRADTPQSEAGGLPSRAGLPSRVDSPGIALSGMRHRRGGSMARSPGSMGGSSMGLSAFNVMGGGGGGGGLGATSPTPNLSSVSGINMSGMGGGGTGMAVTPGSYLRMPAGPLVGAALGMAPARPFTPETGAPTMAHLVQQMVAQRRIAKRNSMEVGGLLHFPSPSSLKSTPQAAVHTVAAASSSHLEAPPNSMRSAMRAQDAPVSLVHPQPQRPLHVGHAVSITGYLSPSASPAPSAAPSPVRLPVDANTHVHSDADTEGSSGGSGGATAAGVEFLASPSIGFISHQPQSQQSAHDSSQDHSGESQTQAADPSASASASAPTAVSLAPSTPPTHVSGAPAAHHEPADSVEQFHPLVFLPNADGSEPQAQAHLQSPFFMPASPRP